MKPRDLRELLGGYAAGTLTAEEREALFQAALENQALFDALADEEALRELLADPACRAQLLRDLGEQSAGFWQRFAEWMRKPATLAFAGSAAALVLVIGVVRFAQREPKAPTLVAQAPLEAKLPPSASIVRQPEPKPMRPGAPPAEKTVEEDRQEPAARANAAAPEPMRPTAPPAQTPAAPAPVATPEPMRLAAPPAQTRDERVREAPAAPAPVAKPQPAALSCVILARSSQGDWIETAPDATFREGAEVRLRVRSAEDGSILATARDGAMVTMLTPPAGAPVSSGQDLILPRAGSFELAGASGEKNVRISFLPRLQAATVTALQFAKSAALPPARRKGEAADSAAAPAVKREAETAKSTAAPTAGTSAAAPKRKAEVGESREDAAKTAAARAAGASVDAAKSAETSAARTRADAAKTAATPVAGAIAEAAKPPLVIEIRLVYRAK